MVCHGIGTGILPTVMGRTVLERMVIAERKNTCND